MTSPTSEASFDLLLLDDVSWYESYESYFELGDVYKYNEDLIDEVLLSDITDNKVCSLCFLSRIT